MLQTIITNTNLVNEGTIETCDVLLANGIIQGIGRFQVPQGSKVIDGSNKYLMPGVIDGQVHLRDPGLTHKADMYTESKAAVAGGVTSFIDMPNTKPNVLTFDIWREKYRIATEKSLANFGFFMGVNAENIKEVLEMDTSQFLALSDDGLYFTKRGNLLADNTAILDPLFSGCKCIIALHSEKEKIIEQNEYIYRKKYGKNIPFSLHPIIRSTEACLKATQELIALAQKHNARLHILHLTTAAEAELFHNDIPLEEKRITTEVCVQHLWFSDKDYDRLGSLIKWNPAIKSEDNRQGLLKELVNDRIDIITTDHAPHALAEKSGGYFDAVSGAPMIQHSLNIMLELYKQGLISLEKIVEKMCHNPAILYQIYNRGFIKEGYAADLLLVDLNKSWRVTESNILYKCGWSPLKNTTFQTKVTHTFVNGCLVYEEGKFHEDVNGQALVKSQRLMKEKQ